MHEGPLKVAPQDQSPGQGSCGPLAAVPLARMRPLEGSMQLPHFPGWLTAGDIPPCSETYKVFEAVKGNQLHVNFNSVWQNT